MWVVVKIMTPFWGILNIRCHIIIRTQKRTIILTTTHIDYVSSSDVCHICLYVHYAAFMSRMTSCAHTHASSRRFRFALLPSDMTETMALDMLPLHVYLHIATEPYTS